MNISKAKYIKTIGETKATVVATIDEKEMFVPIDPANRHYAAILEWAKIDGNTIAEAD